MSTAEKVLYLLESNRDKYTSGEEMASRCGVSRNAVWKAIRELKSRGYYIDAVSNKGYKLSEINNIISAEGIRSYLTEPENSCFDISVYESLESTNNEAKILAMKGAAHGTVIVATRQSGGRGRKDHSFFSPEGGLYLSIVLRPENLPYTDSNRLTDLVGKAVSGSIQELTGITSYVEGINDLYVDGKKICGILLESGSEFDSGTLQWVVAGIGINFDSDIDSFPEEIRDRAASLFAPGKATITKNELIAHIIQKIIK
ncbi:MAG: biotin--[acetyl-CoA-carboxylase] ligase [Butyrivibrio sp.]|nr:biotin--[acetyl-CoA-carboxylase] ligase [Butyrivibrio sp.]